MSCLQSHVHTTVEHKNQSNRLEFLRIIQLENYLDSRSTRVLISAGQTRNCFLIEKFTISRSGDLSSPASSMVSKQPIEHMFNISPSNPLKITSQRVKSIRKFVPRRNNHLGAVHQLRHIQTVGLLHFLDLQQPRQQILW